MIELPDAWNAAAAALHQWDRLAGAVERPSQVGVQGAVPDVVGQCLKVLVRCELSPPGVVDQYVKCRPQRESTSAIMRFTSASLATSAWMANASPLRATIARTTSSAASLDAR